MNKKSTLLVSLAFLFALGCSDDNRNKRSNDDRLREASGISDVKDFADQITGITATTSGRTFISVPRWRDGISYSVAEVKSDGSVVPYPNAEWNSGDGTAVDGKFVCVQSVVAYGNSLYVLDPSNPKMMGVVGTPKLYEFDLTTNTLKNTWSFPEAVAPGMSYLNDLRLDKDNNQIVMTESGLGAIVVLNLNTGVARRLLDKHPSTKAEVMVLFNKGKAFTKDNGQPQKINADGIELRDGYVYYHALTAKTLYRIPTSALADESLSATALASTIENLGETVPTDGMFFDNNGNLIMGNLVTGGIVYRTPSGQLQTLSDGGGLYWPDTFTIDKDGKLLFTDSHLGDVIPGQPTNGTLFNIYKMSTPAVAL